MKTVLFWFLTGIAESRKHELLQQIRNLPGVHRAGLLAPDGGHPDVRRLGYASLDQAYDAKIFMDRLGESSEIVRIEEASPRTLG